MTVKVTTAPEGPVASAVMSSGTFTTGGVVSSTSVTVVVSAPGLPAASVTQTRIVLSPGERSEAFTVDVVPAGAVV